MRVPYNWLREYVPVELEPEELAEKLTMAGIAVEELVDPGAPYRSLRVGEVTELKPHPETEKLLVCRVRLSDGEITVITAARNLRTGDKVPVALAGTRLPDGRLIEETVFKGVLSQGMLCSEEELGLSRQAGGIMVLPAQTRLEDDFIEILELNAPVLVLELTPNRADCYGMLGVAREVAALTGCPLNPPALEVREESKEKMEDFISVELQDPDLCPRYMGRVFFDLEVGESPLWLKTRLLAAGMRPVNNVVDLTNYVMWELNQPLHAFDLDRLAGPKIIVRRARPGETLVTLDDVERKLEPDQLVIADAEKAQGIAGVMGGGSSEVTANTRRVFLEAAYFSPVSIRRTAQAQAIRSEAALRFGKGIDPEGVKAGLNRAAFLLNKLGIGKVCQGMIDYYPVPVPAKKISLRPDKINSLLGTALDPGYIKEILRRLQFGIEEAPENRVTVTVPSYRRDIEYEADLAEEVARIHGYDKIPTTYPAAKRPGALTPRQQFEKKLRILMQGYGLSEVVTYSFHGEKVFDRLNLSGAHPLRNTVRLKVPLSEEYSMMRTTLLGGILDVLSYNAKRRQDDLSIYELARVYLPSGEEKQLPGENLHLAGGLMGRAAERGWNQPDAPVDFYDGKGLVESLLTDLRIPGAVWRRDEHPALHPGRTACLELNGRKAGVVGEVHPDVKERYDLASPVVLFELDVEALWTAAEKETINVKPLPKYPPVLRDLAVVAPEQVRVEEIVCLLVETGGEVLEKVDLFDVYSGGQIPPGHRSLAFSLVFRMMDRTLQDEEVNEKLEEMIAKLATEFKAVVRR